MAGAKWTPEEDAILVEVYETTRTKDIMPLLPNRTYGGIANRATHLGLKKPVEQIAKMAREAYERDPDKYKKGQYKKGDKPWNAGMKGLMLNDGSTCFKKGHEPHNTRKDGDISIRVSKGRAYKWIRVAKSNWVLLHRLVWEQFNGPIPSGYNVVFKDGDTMNCQISNLELVSDADNMVRNSLHNYPKDLADVIRLTGVLKRLIKTRYA